MNEDFAGHPSVPVVEAERSLQNPSNSFPWRSSLLLSLLIAIIWTLARLVLLHSLGFPDPKVPDEFNYILGADTFLHGRLTNPQHPLAAFLISPHTLYEPTYSSKYPPGQSVFLAAGQLLFGHYFYGVVIESALMMFLLCLMLCLWTSRWAAVLVSLAVAAFFQPPQYWVDSYWGGCAAVCGGALLLIGIGWYRLSASPWTGCLFAAGGLLLFVTRPYEGAITFVVTLALMAISPIVPRAFRRAQPLLKATLWGLPVAVIGFSAVAAQDYAVTGHLLQLPRQRYDGTYMLAPIFAFQSARHTEPVYPNPRFAATHGLKGWDFDFYKNGQGATQHGVVGRLLSGVRYIFDFLPQAPLLLLALGLFDRRIWFCFGILAAGAVAASLLQIQMPHYMAPSLPALILVWGILVQLALPLREGRIPLGAIAAVVVLFLGASPSIGSALRARADLPSRLAFWTHQRTELIQRLSAADKPSLVIVHYPSWSWHVGDDYVYNSADIDHQKVIFAHDLGADKNVELLNYYRDRNVWLLTFDPGNINKIFVNPYAR